MISLGVTETMAGKTTIDRVESVIHLIRGQRVMLDSDLAQIYQVTTKQLNQQLKRNRDRFPEDFAFQLTAQEFTSLRSQIVTSKTRGGRRYLPWVFTEHGAPSHDEAIVDYFAALKRLLEPEPKAKREIGFHVRERAPRYRTKKRF